jgi:prepilin-type N-terminal cleavage/methylation domain-containing protein
MLFKDRNSRPCARGFTFVELSVGLVVVALVLTALAAFSLATAEAWKQGSTSNPVGNGQTVASVAVMSNLATTRINHELQDTLCTGGYFPGTLTSSSGQQASLLVWWTDGGNKSVDPSEVELIEYDATQHAVLRYRPGATPASCDYTTFSNNSFIATFKAAAATPIPIARNIDGMQIFVNTPSSSTQLPVVEYRLYFKRDGHSQVAYGSVCLRSPTYPSGMTLN